MGFLGMSRMFLAVFLMVFPFQVQSLVYTGTNFLSGNFNAYRVVAVHMGDVLLLSSLLFWGLAHWKGEVGRTVTLGERVMAFFLIMFMTVMAGGVVLADDKVLFFLMSLQVAVAGLLYLMIVNGVLSREEVLKFLLAGLVLQAALAVGQYFNGHSLGLPGEPVLASDIPGVAKIDWNGMKILRSYGTFPHANILGGALFMGMMFSFYLFRKKHLLLVAFTALFSAGFLLSFSRSAVFAMMAAFLLYVSLNEGRRIMRFVLLAVSMMVFFIVAFNLEGVFFQRYFFLGGTEAVTERVGYMSIGKKMLFDNPLGVGLGGFTNVMQDYTDEKIAPWVYQPVHNVFLLSANETGIQGAAILLLLIVYVSYRLIKGISKKDEKGEERNFGQILLAVFGGIVIIAFFDHYFYSIYQGRVLLVIFLALASSYLKKFELPRRNS